ncbi:MAG: N-acetylmuramoyl-L-alanine amidase [Nitrospiraceae bacterium]|nr:N-acetylmuramoyl-L-alanine amidase [Nitrospiraceae bacterium]
MISAFSRKKELRQRQEILKGIYEENLRIVGKRRGGGLVKQRRFAPGRVLMIFFLAAVAVLAGGGYLNAPPLADKQTTPRMMASPVSFAPSAEAPNSSDFRAFLTNRDLSVSRTFGLGVKTIMIDPGHGGADCGTKGKMGTAEKDIALDIAKRLKALLDKYGRFHVVMTRDTDATLPLNKRVELAREEKADLFISIHLNYLPSKPINIIETYYFGPSADRKTQKLAEQENAGSQYGLAEFKEVIEKLGQKLKLQESRELAYSIQKDLFVNMKKENGNAYNFGVKRAPFVVLLGAEVPAVLAEVSCLSNREEEKELNTDRHRENIAHYLEAGILDYINKGEAGYEADRYAEKR